MRDDRREFLERTLIGSAALSACPTSLLAGETSTASLARAAEMPVLDRRPFKSAVVIESVDLLRHGNQFLVRVRSTDGAVGYAVSHNSKMESLYPILVRLVSPYFVGKDARNLDQLIDGVYLHQSNYKLQGLALWICVASVEFAILDLLGQIAGASVSELLGGRVRDEIGIYLANNHRGKSAEASVDRITASLAKYPAKAIKFKIGGRMSNREQPSGRTEALIPLLRETLGDEITIYADSNGSYDAPEAIRIGRILQAHDIAFYEEPCPFDHLQATRQVAAALDIPIAGGEQESSLRRFRWMVEHQAVQIVQPDLFYFGGFVRSIRVARMAAAAGMQCIPHMSGVPLGYLYILHFASCVPNAGEHMEYKGKQNAIPFVCDSSSLDLKPSGTITAPSGPGLGIIIEKEFIERAKIVSAAS